MKTVYQNFSVWKLNDCEWWAGLGLEQAIKEAIAVTECSREEVTYGMDKDPVNLRKCKMWIVPIEDMNIDRNKKVKYFFQKLFFYRSMLYVLRRDLMWFRENSETKFGFMISTTEY
jgi:hypothetical protein